MRCVRLAAGLCVLLWAVASRGQDAAGVNGQGHAIRTPHPTALRIQLSLTAKGKSVEEALSRLHERQSAAADFLVKLGSEKKSIRHGPLNLTAGDDSRGQLQRMIRQRASGRPKGKDAPKQTPEAKTVGLSATLTAEFRLEAKDADALFLAGRKLQEKIKAAKLAKAKAEEEKKTEEDGPEENEDFSPYGDRDRDPNEPLAVYVARISKDERDQAMAEAFQKAKQDAQESAGSIGTAFGPPASVNEEFQAERNWGRSFGRYDPSWNETFQSPSDDDEEDSLVARKLESLSPGSGQAAFHFTVRAGFGAAAHPGSGVSPNPAATVVPVLPSVLRLHLMVIGKGKTTEGAMANLKDRREAAVAALEQFGADKRSIAWTAPAVSEEDAQRRRELERMIHQRLRSGTRSARKVKLPESVTVACVLTAEWPLEPKDLEALVLIGRKIRDQVIAARLATGKEAEKLSDEEKELMEEMGAEMGRFSSSDQAWDPNRPLVVFVARITPDRRAKARAEALAKVKADAQRLAHAAGVTLGPMLAVSNTSNGTVDMSQPSAGPSHNMPAALTSLVERQQSAGRHESQATESICPDPSRTAFTFQSAAAFRLAGARDDAPVISGNGIATVQKFPTRTQVQVLIPGKGKTLDEAVADLKKKTQSALAQLEKLGAEKKSLKAGLLTLPDVPPRAPGGLRPVEPFSAPRRGAKEPRLPETVTALAPVTAQWPVEAKTAEELFLAMQKLREKIEAAKLAGEPPADKQPPGEDAAEETMSPDSVAPETGVPPAGMAPASFTFLASITEAERRKALAEALEKARADAARITQLARLRLGPPVQIGGGESNARQYYGGPYSRRYPYAQAFVPSPYYSQAYMETVGPLLADGENADECEGRTMSPGPVTFSYSAHTTFAVEPADAKPAAASK